MAVTQITYQNAAWSSRSSAFVVDTIEATKVKGDRPVKFDHAKIVALRNEGLGATQIAKRVGCKLRWSCRGTPQYGFSEAVASAIE
jgi:hypothetical protein